MIEKMGVVGNDRYAVDAATWLGFDVEVLCPGPTQFDPKVQVTAIDPMYQDEGALQQFGANKQIVLCGDSVPLNTIQFLRQRVPRLWPSVIATQVSRDRLLARKLFQKLRIPACRFFEVRSFSDLIAAAEHLGALDIKGRYRDEGFRRIRIRRETARNPQQLGMIWEEHCQGKSIEFLAEEPMFSHASSIAKPDYRVSMTGVRSTNGQIVVYPLMMSLYEQGVQYYTHAITVPTDLNSDKERQGRYAQAKRHVRRILQHRHHEGALTVEFFDIGGKLYAHKITAASDTSLNLTIAAAHTDYKTNIIHAITGSPLGATKIIGHAGMFNFFRYIPVDKRLENPHIWWMEDTTLGFGGLSVIQAAISTASFDDFLTVAGEVIKRYETPVNENDMRELRGI